MKYDHYSKMFSLIGDRPILVDEGFGVQGSSITVEELYQHFKARIIQEVGVRSDELLDDAKLEGQLQNISPVAVEVMQRGTFVAGYAKRDIKVGEPLEFSVVNGEMHLNDVYAKDREDDRPTRYRD